MNPRRETSPPSCEKPMSPRRETSPPGRENPPTNRRGRGESTIQERSPTTVQAPMQEPN